MDLQDAGNADAGAHSVLHGFAVVMISGPPISMSKLLPVLAYSQW